MRRATIKLQNIDGSFNRHLTSSELATMIQKGDVTEITKSKKKKAQAGNAFIYRLVAHPPALRTMEEASPPSITSSDMMANAGLCESRSRIRDARAKVEEFRHRIILPITYVDALPA